mmetsp:Transcript_447/g.757  ORF Transcript_447/g.757 Transcript_447/m.757 type:complete len:252 (-) Transcript_447:62-817(-)
MPNFFFNTAVILTAPNPSEAPMIKTFFTQFPQVSAELQNKLMYDLIHHSAVTTANFGENICNWMGVICDSNGITRQIVWRGNQSGFVVPLRTFGSFPPSVHTIVVEFSRAHENNEILTRRLPQLLEYCFFHNCCLVGTVDMRCLPANIRIFSLPENSLRGVVDLSQLPETIEIIDLRHNPIECVVYDAAKLPESLKDARVQNPKVKRTKILALYGADDNRVWSTHLCYDVNLIDKYAREDHTTATKFRKMF